MENVRNITLKKRDVYTHRFRVGYFLGKKQRWRYFPTPQKANVFLKGIKTLKYFK